MQSHGGGLRRPARAANVHWASANDGTHFLAFLKGRRAPQAEGLRRPGGGPRQSPKARRRRRRRAPCTPDVAGGAGRAGGRDARRTAAVCTPKAVFAYVGGCLTGRGGPVSVLFHLLGVFPGAGCLGGGLGGVGTRVNGLGARLKDCAEKGPKTALFGAVFGGFWEVTPRVWARSTRHKWEMSF